MTSLSRDRGWWRAGVASALLLASSAGAAERVAIDQTLRRTPIDRLVSLSDQGLTFTTRSGATRAASADEFVAMTEPAVSGVAPVAGAGWVDLTDGARFVGAPGELTSDGETLAWRHADFGVIRLGLERVSRVVLPVDDSAERPPAAESDALLDRVALLNGDVLRGFVASVGDDVVIELESGGRAVTALDLVSEVRLANPPTTPSGAVVWLDDGSAVPAASVSEAGSGRARVELVTGEAALLPAGRVVAIVFDAASLRPLEADTVENWRTPPERRWSPPATTDPSPGSDRVAPLFARDLLAPGPMALRWALPEGAGRFATTAELSSAGLPWGDCEIVVRVDGRELARERLWRERTSAAINVALDGGAAIEIEIESGRFGPVGDAVRLIDPLVLVRPETASD